MTTTPIAKLEAHEFASALMLMKFRAGQLGLWKTMHAIEPATQAVGYEMAEQIEAATHIGAKEEADRKARRREHFAPRTKP